LVAGTDVVLLAEDDPKMRGLLALALRHDGYTVIEAEDGIQLLEQIRLLVRGIDDAGDTNPRTMIVSDHRMPKCNGIDALVALRREEYKLPFLLITAFGDRDLHESARSLGAMVLDKPFPLAEFRKAVQRSFAGRR
jgi:DNA-binding response OmpR family regulator